MKGMPISEERKTFRRILLFLGSCLFALLLAESVVRIFSFDWRFVPRLLYYQKTDIASYEADPDPLLLYHLTPSNGKYYGPQGVEYRVTINSLGVRGPERSAKKPVGVFRIICVGASNVYGAAVSDDQTWPAQLEAELNRLDPGRYEVWNMGTSAYVGVQIATAAGKAAERFDPDLVILAPSNMGERPFLWGSDVRKYFDRDPDLWRFLFSAECLTLPKFLSYETKLKLVQYIRLYRYIAAYRIAGTDCGWSMNGNHEPLNAATTRNFLIWAQSRHVKTCLFFYPGVVGDFSDYYAGTDVPILRLSAKGMPPAYLEVHPPPTVLEWYGQTIAAWLVEQRLVPPPGN